MLVGSTIIPAPAVIPAYAGMTAGLTPAFAGVTALEVVICFLLSALSFLAIPPIPELRCAMTGVPAALGSRAERVPSNLIRLIPA